MTITIRIICLLIGYVFGMISPAYFYAKAKGRNIKHVGSGNAGTTNVMREFGKKAGILVFFGDFIKAFIACIICILLFGDAETSFDGSNKLVVAYTALGAVCGHCFPFYLKFDGGKGVVVAFASMLLIDWTAALCAFTLFLIISLTTRYVSLGSLIAAVTFYTLYFIFNTTGTFSFTGEMTKTGFSNESAVVVLIIFLIIFFKHKENIKRLIRRKENKISFSSKKK